MLGKRKLWVILAGFVVLTLGGVWSVLNYAGKSAEKLIDEDRGKLSALGYPVTFEEFRSRLPQAGPDNAAPIYQKAIAEYERLGKPKHDYTASSGKVDRAKLAAYVSKTAPVLELALQASEKPTCVFDRRWEDGAKVPFPEMAPLKEFVWMARAKAEHVSAKGDWKAALDLLAAGMRMSKHAQEPMFIGHLVAIATDLTVTRGFAEVATDHREDPAFHAAARKWLEELPPPPDRTRAFDFEFVQFDRAIEQILEPAVAAELGIDFESNEGRVVHAYLNTEVARAQVSAVYYQEMRTTLEPPYKGPHEDVQRWIDHEKRTTVKRSLAGTVCLIFMLPFVDMAEAFARVADNRRLADAVLWVLEQSRTSGKRPSELPDDARFRDYWTGNPFVIGSTATGFYVRSLGPNKTDDGGTAKDDADDVELRVER